MSEKPVMARLSVCVVVVVGFGCIPGCTVGPDYEKPEPEMPDAWHVELTKGLAEGEATLHTWWYELNDPVLDGLIQKAALGNLDLQTALARIDQARALLGVASGQKYPTIQAQGSNQRQKISEEVLGPVVGAGGPVSLHSYGIGGTWEVDLFGRIRRSVESADASLQASVEDYRDLLVVLYAQVASTYIQLRTFQERIRLANQNVESQSATLQLTTDRFEAQIAPELDVRQAELNLARTESAIPPLRTGLMTSVHALGVLLGERPSALYDELTPVAPIPGTPDEVAVGFPADLLRQRPDVRAAERSLAAQTAEIGVATADLYPQLQLVGDFGWQATDAAKLGNGFNWALGPQFSWNLFAGGRIRNNIRAQDALAQAALFQYEQTVLLALQEVEDSMVAYTEEKDRREDLARSVTAAERSVELVQTLYTTGLTDFQNVLDMQRSLFQQQDDLAVSEGQVTQNLISIYQALGGGWQVEPEEVSTAPDDPPDSSNASG